MAAKVSVWNVNVDGNPYQVEFYKNKLTINGEEQKIMKFAHKTKFPNTEYYIPLGAKMCTLFVREFTDPVLVIDGRNCITGEPYEFTGMPAWGWVFVVLHAVNFFLLIGGAIGGAMCAGFAYLSGWVASNKKMSTVARVFACLGMWIGAIILEFIVVIAVSLLI